MAIPTEIPTGTHLIKSLKGAAMQTDLVARHYPDDQVVRRLVTEMGTLIEAVELYLQGTSPRAWHEAETGRGNLLGKALVLEAKVQAVLSLVEAELREGTPKT